MHTNRTEHGEKCINMQEYKLKVYIYALKCAKSATFPLTTPLTPYLSPYYLLHKYTEAKNPLKSSKTEHRAKVFVFPVQPIYENSNSLQSFLSPSHIWNTSAAPYIRKLFKSAKFSSAVVVS